MSELDEIFTAPKEEQEDVSIPAFDKDEWVHQKRAERQQAFSTIEQMAQLMITDPSRIQTYLDLQSRFPRYSVGNILLIAAHKPDATKIADYQSWKDGGVHIKRGESGIIILEPGNEYTREDGSTGVSYN